MENEDLAIRSIAEEIVSECKVFNQGVLEDLRPYAPETTPAELEIRLGNARYALGDSSHTSYLQAAIYSYLKFHDHSVRAPQSEELHHKITKDGFLDWSKRYGAAAGTSMPGQNFIWVAFLPDEFEENLASNISAKASETPTSVEPKIFGDFVRTLSKRGKLQRKTREDYMGTVSHELTHLLMNQKTKVGQLYHEHDMDDVDLDNEISHLLGDKTGLTKTEQAKEVGNNKYVTAIDEAFAFFIQDTLTSDLNPSSASRFSSYDHPEGISWGYNILLERFGETTSIDSLRKLQFKVFNEIAQRGQVRNDSGYRNPLVYLLKNVLPETDQKLLSNMREICEGDLAKAFTDLHKSIKHSESETRDPRLQKELQNLEQRTDWENPREIEDLVLHHVLDTSAGKHSIQETRQLLRNSISEELQILQNLINELEKIEHNTSENQIDRNLSNALKEIITAENEIEKVLKQA